MERNKVIVTVNDLGTKTEVSLNVNKFIVQSRYSLMYVDGVTGKRLPVLVKSLGPQNRLRNIFDNSLENPVVLFKDSVTHLYTATYPAYYNYMVFEDTGNISIQILMKTVSYSLNKNQLFTDKKKRAMYTLYIEKTTGIPRVFKNGKFVYTDRELSNFFSHVQHLIGGNFNFELRDFIVQAFTDHFLDGNSPHSIRWISHYRLKRSSSIVKDLPWTSYENLLSLYNVHQTSLSNATELAHWRSKVLRYLRAGNTKKATDACFFNCSFPKSIRKMFIAEGPFKHPKSFYELVQEHLKVKDISIVRSALNFNGGLGYYKLYIALIELGFSPKHINNVVTRQGIRIIRDTLRLHNNLNRDGDLNIGSNIPEYHDYLIDVDVVRNPKAIYGVDYSELYKETDTSTQREMFKSGEYTFRSPKDPTELAQVGLDLIICVGSYQAEFFLKKLEIVLVTDTDNKYIACIEVRNNIILQAKTRRNNRACEDKVLFEATTDWAKHFNLIPATIDLDVTRASDLNTTVIPCPARASLLKEFNDKNPRPARNDNSNVVWLDDFAF